MSGSIPSSTGFSSTIRVHDAKCSSLSVAPPGLG